MESQLSLMSSILRSANLSQIPLFLTKYPIFPGIVHNLTVEEPRMILSIYDHIKLVGKSPFLLGWMNQRPRTITKANKKPLSTNSNSNFIYEKINGRPLFNNRSSNDFGTDSPLPVDDFDLEKVDCRVQSETKIQGKVDSKAYFPQLITEWQGERIGVLMRVLRAQTTVFDDAGLSGAEYTMYDANSSFQRFNNISNVESIKLKLAALPYRIVIDQIVRNEIAGYWSAAAKTVFKDFAEEDLMTHSELIEQELKWITKYSMIDQDIKDPSTLNILILQTKNLLSENARVLFPMHSEIIVDEITEKAKLEPSKFSFYVSNLLASNASIQTRVKPRLFFILLQTQVISLRFAILNQIIKRLV